jgi:hypothetical protein
MNKTKPILVLALTAATVAVGVLLAINPFGASFVQANQGRSGAQRWEYCAITNDFRETNDTTPKGKMTIRYFTQSGVRDEVIEFNPGFGERKPGLRADTLAVAIARLGAAEWEMVLKQSDSDNGVNYIYFKRPLP